MNKKLLLITSTIYPDNTAMYVRHHTLAKLFRQIGWEVLILSRGKNNGQQIKEWDSIPYLSVSGKRQTKLDKIIDYEFRMLHYVKKLLNENHFDAILLTGSSNRILKYLKDYGRKHETILLHDSVEWYSPEQFNRGERARDYIKKEYWMNEGISKEFRVIAISSYLESHFAEKGCRTIRIPAFMDMNSIACQKYQKEERCVIMYAGSPGKKDYLKEVVEGCSRLEIEQLRKLELRLIGVNKEQLEKQCEVPVESINAMGAALHCLGRIPREQVLINLQEADFTILLRPEDARYAKAGFPTKVTESLASATAVICNLTSDLGMYIKDLENGIVMKGCSSNAVKEAVEKALGLEFITRKNMCQKARETAEEYFDCYRYEPDLRRLLDK